MCWLAEIFRHSCPAAHMHAQLINVTRFDSKLGTHHVMQVAYLRGFSSSPEVDHSQRFVMHAFTCRLHSCHAAMLAAEQHKRLVYTAVQLTFGHVSAGTPRTMASWGCLPQQGSNTRTMNPTQSQALLPAWPAHASRRAGRQGTVQTSAQSVRPQVRAELERADCALCLPPTAGILASARHDASVGHAYSPAPCA
jgi:hypothetical protein